MYCMIQRASGSVANFVSDDGKETKDKNVFDVSAVDNFWNLVDEGNPTEKKNALDAVVKEICNSGSRNSDKFFSVMTSADSSGLSVILILLSHVIVLKNYRQSGTRDALRREALIWLLRTMGRGSLVCLREVVLESHCRDIIRVQIGRKPGSP